MNTLWRAGYASVMLVLVTCFVATPNTSWAQKQTAKKVLFVLSSHAEKGNTGEKTGYYLSEAAHPWAVLTEAGFEVDFVSPEGGEPPVDGFDLEDAVNKRFWTNKTVQQKLKNTMRPEEVNPENYAAMHYVGGHGTMWDFPDNKELAQIAATIYENKGVVSAVCHGPAGILNIKLSSGKYLIEGKKLTGFTNAEEEAVKLTEVVPFLLETSLKARGASFSHKENWAEHVVTDERLVTGQNPASAHKVGEAVRDLLKK